MFRAGTAFNPNYDRFLEFNKSDYYQFFTARRAGKIVGNAGMYVTEGMHDRRKVAVEDTWYISPEERGMAGVMFLGFVERDLLAQGVQEVYMTTKLANRSGVVAGVATTNGALALLHTSHTPIPSLLATMERLLLSVCTA